jgi:hypothetical protein
MKRFFQKSVRYLGLAAGLALFLWLTLSLMQPAAPVRADLPPRPDPTETAVPPKSDSIKGAQIKLMVAQPIGNEWTVVEWQNPMSGEWTAVEGWQGTLELDGTQVWWVGREHFGDGPFRWLVYASEDGQLLETSESFTMPTRDLEVVLLRVPVVDDE